MSDMTGAAARPAPTSPSPRPGLASPRQPDNTSQATRANASGRQLPADRQAAAAAAAAAALTGPPKASTAAAHATQPRCVNTAATHRSPVQSARGASPFEQSAALPSLPAVSSGPPSKSQQASSLDGRPASADVHSPSSAQGDTAVPTLPPVTGPVRKPPGLPSPVPAAQGQGSADLDSVISSDRWPDQVSAKSETSSNPRSPKKGIKVPAVVPPLPPPTLSASASAAVSEIMSETGSEDGSSFEGTQSISSSQPLDQSAAAIAARLEKERVQQRKQEAKHLASRQRAYAKRQQEIADQDRRQQEEHAHRVALKAKANAEKEALVAPGLHPPVSDSFQPPAAGFRDPGADDRPLRGSRDFDDAPPQQAPKSYPAGVRHVPAHPGPNQGRSIRPSAYSHPDSDYGSDYGGSDYGGSEHESFHSYGQGRGRGLQLDRHGKAAVKGAGRGIGKPPVQGEP